MRLRAGFLLWGLWSGALAARLMLAPADADLDVRGATTVLDGCFALLLWGYLLSSALGIGRPMLRLAAVTLTPPESNVLATLLGLAALSIALLMAGLLGWLNRIAILGILGLGGLLAAREWGSLGRQLWEAVCALPAASTTKPGWRPLLGLVPIGCLLLVFNSLTPVWDYDALFYHLEIPRRFLEHGRIYFDSEAFRSAYPFLGEMLFLPGLAFQVDSLAKLTNLGFAALLSLSVFAFCRRFGGRDAGLLAALLFVATPSVPSWATWAGVDFAWAAFEFWALYLILLWAGDHNHRSWRLLALSGILSGLAAGTKYLSLPTIAILGTIVLWQSARPPRIGRSAPFVNLLIYAAAVAVAMSPWYLRNWIWTGNPIYPLVWGGPGWSVLKSQLLNDYVQTFGVHEHWYDYLLLPYHLYANHDRFSTFFLENLNPALWLGFAFPLVKDSGPLRISWIYVVAYSAIWALNAQVIRFLIPPSAVLAVLAALVIRRLPVYARGILVYGLLPGALFVGFGYQLLLLRANASFLLGRESASEYLGRSVNNFRMVQRIQSELRDGELALFLWDGRGYYCASRCLPDHEQSLAVQLTVDWPAAPELARRLRADGVTHLMPNQPDADWFIRYHDPRGLHRRALEYFRDQFIPLCTEPIDMDNGMKLYRMTCP